jgi:hypothetical protein
VASGRGQMALSAGRLYRFGATHSRKLRLIDCGADEWRYGTLLMY